ncbi:MAG TPA: DUF2089 domain-containing protein [Chthonomonadaceae bacterium]|nr:DUF2089 domain-containing protein [Chthonomonadaceae bacterium]
MAKLLTRCPVCESALGISELKCTRCQTRIQGAFDPCRFCRLAPEHLAFVETFLRCEGNLSRVEKELGISYPTVRNKLTAALAALGFTTSGVNGGVEAPPVPPVPGREPGSPVAPQAPPTFPVGPAAPVQPAPPVAGPEAEARRREVLDALARGDLSAEEAASALRELT